MRRQVYAFKHLWLGRWREGGGRVTSQVPSPELVVYFPASLIAEPTCWLPSTQPHQVARLPDPSNLLGKNVELHLIKSIYTETRLIKSLLPRSPLFVFT